MFNFSNDYVQTDYTVIFLELNNTKQELFE